MTAYKLNVFLKTWRCFVKKHITPKPINPAVFISTNAGKIANEGRDCLKWYHDQKIISFFSSDFESVFAKHLTGKILSFVFYPKAVYFECKFWISRSAITRVHN